MTDYLMRRTSFISRLGLSACVLLMMVTARGCGDASPLSGDITIDVGRVEQGTIIERKVRIYDTGDRFGVSTVESDCACTAALLAGESDDEPGSIFVAIDTTSFRGRFRRQVRVKSDSVGSGSRTITFVGFAYSVRPAFSMSEVSFGDVDNRLSHTMEVDLLNPESEANGDWRVTAVVDDTPGVHAEYRAGQGLECTVEQGVPVGRYQGRIAVEYQLNGSDALSGVRTMYLPFNFESYHGYRVRQNPKYLGIQNTDSTFAVTLELVGDVTGLPDQLLDNAGGTWALAEGVAANTARLTGWMRAPKNPGPFTGVLTFQSVSHARLPIELSYAGIATERD